MKHLTLLSFIALNSLLWTEISHAYIDPGSGSFMFQMILASVLGGLFALKVYYQKIKMFLFGAKKPVEETLTPKTRAKNDE